MSRAIKNVLIGSIVCTALAVGSTGLSNMAGGVSQDPFSSIDKIFEMQMRQMHEMRRQMDRLFQNFENNFRSSQIARTPILVHSSGIMSSGFVDKKDHYELEIKVDDLKNSKINITTENGMITIEISKNKKIEKTTGNYGKIISYTNSSSTQSFTLPADADPATVKAEEKDDAILLKIEKKKQSGSTVPIIKKNDINSSKKDKKK